MLTGALGWPFAGEAVAIVLLCELVEMGAARRAAALVRDRVLRSGALSETSVRRGARRFDRLRGRVVAKRGDGSIAIGADLLGID